MGLDQIIKNLENRIENVKHVSDIKVIIGQSMFKEFENDIEKERELVTEKLNEAQKTLEQLKLLRQVILQGKFKQLEELVKHD